MDIGILLWNTCNARCAHCAVLSGPKHPRQMSTDQIKSIIDGAFVDCQNPSIGLSGGEAFFYFDDLMEIVSYATERGARVAINTNCFWAEDFEQASEIVSALVTAKVTKIVASTDDFHRKYIPEQAVINAIRACVDANLEIEVQYVANKKTDRLHDFLRRHSDHLINVTCREIPCHPVGRAENMSEHVLVKGDRVPKGKCPNAVLSVSADGRYIPCCNTAGHLPALEVGHVGQNQSQVYSRFVNSAVMRALWDMGPIGFVEEAESAGYRHPDGGYIDQCHLCYRLFRDVEIASKLRKKAEELAFQELYRLYCERRSILASRLEIS